MNETLFAFVERAYVEELCELAVADDTGAPGTANKESSVGADDTSTRAAASVFLNCTVVWVTADAWKAVRTTSWTSPAAKVVNVVVVVKASLVWVSDLAADFETDGNGPDSPKGFARSTMKTCHSSKYP